MNITDGEQNVLQDFVNKLQAQLQASTEHYHYLRKHADALKSRLDTYTQHCSENELTRLQRENSTLKAENDELTETVVTLEQLLELYSKGMDCIVQRMQGYIKVTNKRLHDAEVKAVEDHEKLVKKRERISIELEKRGSLLKVESLLRELESNLHDVSVQQKI
ncbi:hypothetical protein SJAG_06270 [Schizosaccharomyces japonicus yFS275]|uniref:Uncharacterized protein n=1 Tax=Schizosaccharomyces japonicus (strain yFS275 / FY16936) TaxID=402676 RepID=T0T6I1_SCHJY|nr:hypothetical protein SJAG_06270 [Schizosaccharomyces japonicus yFS275]EQC53039.1 hypothetical protein SJAG_06270 [Schizosaccharomyces japonicus yFS275]